MTCLYTKIFDISENKENFISQALKEFTSLENISIWSDINKEGIDITFEFDAAPGCDGNRTIKFTLNPLEYDGQSQTLDDLIETKNIGVKNLFVSQYVVTNFNKDRAYCNESDKYCRRYIDFIKNYTDQLNRVYVDEEGNSQRAN